MLVLLPPNAWECNHFWKPSKPCHVGIHWVLSDEYPYVRVSVIFPGILHHFVLANLATSSIRVNISIQTYINMFSGMHACTTTSVCIENRTLISNLIKIYSLTIQELIKLYIFYAFSGYLWVIIIKRNEPTSYNEYLTGIKDYLMHKNNRVNFEFCSY